MLLHGQPPWRNGRIIGGIITSRRRRRDAELRPRTGARCVVVVVVVGAVAAATDVGGFEDFRDFVVDARRHHGDGVRGVRCCGRYDCVAAVEERSGVVDCGGQQLAFGSVVVIDVVVWSRTGGCGCSRWFAEIIVAIIVGVVIVVVPVVGVVGGRITLGVLCANECRRPSMQTRQTDASSRRETNKRSGIRSGTRDGDSIRLEEKGGASESTKR